ncbi:MAG: hypothetical protein JWN98_1367 [Abditibacteriota bacterium]|nr:hypothetical protein [Abditibacteriota bacterium]
MRDSCLRSTLRSNTRRRWVKEATKVLSALASAAPLVGAVATPAAAQGLRDVYADTWVASDALGRRMPTVREAGAPRQEKTVGIFYFLWQERPNDTVFDLTKLLAANPGNPQYGGSGQFHWWGEPLFGYYLASDPFVIRKHAQMLSDAGVDVIVFDNTNGLTYPESYLPICRVFMQMRAQGIKTPQIAFFPNQGAADRLWKEFYSQNIYPELWFRWKGKPFIQIKPEVNLPAEANEFFAVRRSWAWSNPGGWFGDGRDKWPWLDSSPQRFGWHEDPKRPEHVSVAVAQHPTTSIGRSHQNNKQPSSDERYLTPTMGQGIYFSEQWKRALEVSPEFIFVTGWNEWIAQRYYADADGTFGNRPQKKGDTVFVDAFSEEFNRDAEPNKLSSGDNYYYQLAANIRRYKGARNVPRSLPLRIKLDGRFDDWRGVGPEYRDTQGDEVRRDSPGWKGFHYKNQSGRNDIVSSKVSLDQKNLYFYARTQSTLSAPTGANWMLLFIDADQNPKTGWMGYDFVVNRGITAKSTLIARNIGGQYQWGNARPVKFMARDSEVEIAIPRWILGNATNFDFKWADNCFEKGDWSDFTLNGDAAPNDRFNYRYQSDNQ